MIRVVCICGRAFKAEDRHAGKNTKCPECGAGLTIGPAPIPTSTATGGDAKEAPPWWYPNDRAAQADRATAPTRSGTDPGADAVNTVVLPSGYSSNPQAPIQSLPPGAPTSAPVSPPKTASGLQMKVPDHPSFPAKGIWVIVGGTIALLVLALGLTIWLRSPTRPQFDVAGHPKPAAAGAARRLCLLVPVYIYPSGDGRKEWQRLIDAASKVEIVAIANPNSGPGIEPNLDYAAVFTEARNRGITLLGYVSTDYGKRPQAEIKKDVDTWIRFYPQVRGFFFDQQPSSSRDAARYEELRDFVRLRLRDPLVITNPGVPCDEAYLARAVSNVTCVFVNFQGFNQFELPAQLKAYDPSRFAAMPYNIPDVETMRAVVKEAIIKRIGYLYISDAKPTNPWDKLPAYWEDEVEAISRDR
jgi:hypothetical protein